MDHVVDHGVHSDCHGVSGEDLLGRHIETDRPEVHLPVVVHTAESMVVSLGLGEKIYSRDDEEYPGTLGASWMIIFTTRTLSCILLGRFSI